MGNAMKRQFEEQLARITTLRRLRRLAEAHDEAMALLARSATASPGPAFEHRGIRVRLAAIFEAPRSDWSTIYTYPDRTATQLSERYFGQPPLAERFEESAEDEMLAISNESRAPYLLAAASVYAEFGCTGTARVGLLDRLWAVLFDLGRYEDALSAATAMNGFTRPDDRLLLPRSEEIVGRTLLRLGRPREALPYLRNVLAHRLEKDPERRIEDWVDEAARWIAAATASQ